MIARLAFDLSLSATGRRPRGTASRTLSPAELHGADREILVTRPQRAALALFYDERIRATFYQCLLFGLVSWGLWYLVTNTSENLHARGMSTGFGFLSSSAGFDTDFKLITYRPDHTYARIYLVGILNTLFVSWGAILGATAIGLVMGVARLSTNWLVAKLASAYVEILRNTPLLIQIVCWYLGIFALLPGPKQSLDFFDVGIAYLNNRGLYLPGPLPQDQFWLTGLAMALAIGAVFWLRAWAKDRLARTGEPFPVLIVSLAILIGLPGLAFLATGQPLEWEIAALQGFNYQGGLRLPPSFLALVIALTIYHSAGMTETVRAASSRSTRASARPPTRSVSATAAPCSWW